MFRWASAGVGAVLPTALEHRKHADVPTPGHSWRDRFIWAGSGCACARLRRWREPGVCSDTPSLAPATSREPSVPYPTGQAAFWELPSSSPALAGKGEGGTAHLVPRETWSLCVPAPVGGGGWNWSQLREQPGLVRAHPGFPAGVGEALCSWLPWDCRCVGGKKKKELEKGISAVLQASPSGSKKAFFWQKGWAAPSCTHTQPQAAGIFVPCPWLRAPEAEQGREHPSRAPGGSCGGQLQPPACPGGEGKPKPELREGCGAPPFPWEPQVCVFPPGCQLGPAPQPCSTCPVL